MQRTIARGKLQLGWRIIISDHPVSGVVSITVYRRLLDDLEIRTAFTKAIIGH